MTKKRSIRTLFKETRQKSLGAFSSDIILRKKKKGKRTEKEKEKPKEKKGEDQKKGED